MMSRAQRREDAAPICFRGKRIFHTEKWEREKRGDEKRSRTLCCCCWSTPAGCQDSHHAIMLPLAVVHSRRRTTGYNRRLCSGYSTLQCTAAGKDNVGKCWKVVYTPSFQCDQGTALGGGGSSCTPSHHQSSPNAWFDHCFSSPKIDHLGKCHDLSFSSLSLSLILVKFFQGINPTQTFFLNHDWNPENWEWNQSGQMCFSSFMWDMFSSFHPVVNSDAFHTTDWPLCLNVHEYCGLSYCADAKTTNAWLRPDLSRNEWLLRHGFLLGESIAAVIGPGFPLSPSIPVTVGCRTTRLDLALFLEGGGFCHGPAGSCPQRVIEGLKQLS